MARPKSNKPKLSWRMRQFIKDPQSFTQRRIDNMCNEDVLDEEFIRKYHRFLNWKVISATQHFSKKLIEDFAAWIDWYYYFTYKYEEITDDFIREFVDYLNWSEIIKTEYKFSKDILREFQDRVDWHTYARWRAIPINFMVEMKDRIPFTNCLLHQQFSEEFIEKYIQKFTNTNYYNHYGWMMIPRTQTLSEQFIDKWKNHINWEEVCEKQKLSIQFMRDHANYLVWGKVMAYQKLDEQFILDYGDKITKKNVIIFQNLSQDFMRKHFSDTVDWIGCILYYWRRSYLTYEKKNEGLTKEFIIEMLEHQYNLPTTLPFSKMKIKEMIEHLNKNDWYAMI